MTRLVDALKRIADQDAVTAEPHIQSAQEQQIGPLSIAALPPEQSCCECDVDIAADKQAESPEPYQQVVTVEDDRRQFEKTSYDGQRVASDEAEQLLSRAWDLLEEDQEECRGELDKTEQETTLEGDVTATEVFAAVMEDRPPEPADSGREGSTLELESNANEPYRSIARRLYAACSTRQRLAVLTVDEQIAEAAGEALLRLIEAASQLGEGQLQVVDALRLSSNRQAESTNAGALLATLPNVQFQAIESRGHQPLDLSLDCAADQRVMVLASATATNTPTLLRQCDASVLLVELGQTDRRAASDALARLQWSGIRTTGCIVVG